MFSRAQIAYVLHTPSSIVNFAKRICRKRFESKVVKIDSDTGSNAFAGACLLLAMRCNKCAITEKSILRVCPNTTSRSLRAYQAALNDIALAVTNQMPSIPCATALITPFCNQLVVKQRDCVMDGVPMVAQLDMQEFLRKCQKYDFCPRRQNSCKAAAAMFLISRANKLAVSLDSVGLATGVSSHTIREVCREILSNILPSSSRKHSRVSEFFPQASRQTCDESGLQSTIERLESDLRNTVCKPKKRKIS